MIETLFALCISHAVTDCALQTPGMCQGKRWENNDTWYLQMAGHCLINAGGVWIVTGSPLLALGEFLSHFFVDVLKCNETIGTRIDQAIHFFQKCCWAFACHPDFPWLS